jgi:transposase
VITSVQRRRRWPTAEKIRLVEETMQPGMSVSYVAWRAGVAPSLLFNWRCRMLEGGLQAVQADEDVVGTSRVRELDRRGRELKRLLGRFNARRRIVLIAGHSRNHRRMPMSYRATLPVRLKRGAVQTC